MSNRASAYLLDDGLQPEHGPVRPTTLEIKLQMSINRVLMDRLDALETEMKELRKTVKNLQHMLPV